MKYISMTNKNIFLIGYLGITKTLIENGANVDSRNGLGDTIMTIADKKGD